MFDSLKKCFDWVFGTKKQRKIHAKPTEPIVAYRITGVDMMSHMYEDREDNPGLCPICHRTTFQKILNPNFKVRKRKKAADLHYTYDMFCIVTDRFKEFFESRNYPGVLFHRIPRSEGFYMFDVETLFYCDHYRSNTQFAEMMECCRRPIGVYTPYYRFRSQFCNPPSDDFIAKEPIFYGDGHSGAPVFIVGTKTKEEMEKAGLRKIYYSPIYK